MDWIIHVPNPNMGTEWVELNFHFPYMPSWRVQKIIFAKHFLFVNIFIVLATCFGSERLVQHHYSLSFRILSSLQNSFCRVPFLEVLYSIEQVCILRRYPWYSYWNVWGMYICYREAQLDIKKWEVKQAEKQRNVKLTPDDWVDHPDRYLLELAGRPSYTPNQPQQ